MFEICFFITVFLREISVAHLISQLIDKCVLTGGSARVANDGDVLRIGNIQRAWVLFSESRDVGEGEEVDSDRRSLGFESRKLRIGHGATQNNVAQRRSFFTSEEEEEEENEEKGKE